MKLFHFSDPHLSFVDAPLDQGGEPQYPYANWFHSGLKIAKPMHERTWSKGNDNYVGYLDKIKDYLETNGTWGDLVIITGDLVHDMSKKNIHHSFRWLDKCVRGVKVVIRGNHDWGVDFGELRHPDAGLTHTIMIEELGMTCVGKYAFGCYSNHGGTRTDQMTGIQPAFTNRTLELLDFADRLSKFAKKHKKTPILLSHYPVPKETAEAIGSLGVKAYLSGHVHCTNNKVLPEQADWKWYNSTAAQTDDKTINGCFFSTGTTDVLLNRTGQIVKEVTDKVAPPKQGPKPERKFPQLKGTPAAVMWVTVGVPGCGKSTWAAKQAARLGGAEVICQDELGSRDACENAVAKALSEGKNVIVDRTNIDGWQRAHWVSLAKRYKVKEICCADFSVPIEKCVERVQARTGHKGIPDRVPQDRKKMIVEKFYRQYHKPETSEGFTLVVHLNEKDLDSTS